MKWVLPLLLLFVAVVPAAAILETDVAEKARRQKADFIEKNGDRKIVKFTITGLERTRNIVIEQWIRSEPGDLLSTFQEVDLLENLLRLRIFKTVEIFYLPVEEGVEVRIKPDEKWSLYPIPILYFFNDTNLAGLFLVEGNLLGYNKGATIGGIISNRGWQYLAGYDDPNIGFSDFFGRVRSSGGSIFVENAEPDGTVFQNYQQLRMDILYMAGYTIRDVFSPAITGGYFGTRIPDEENRDKINPPPSGDSVYQGLNLIYSDTRERLYYVLGLRARVEYQHGFPVGGGGYSFDNIIGENSYTMEAFWGHTLSFGFYWSWANMPDVVEHRLGGLEGTRTLPAFLVPADKYATGTIIYQIPIVDFKWGTITTIQFLERGVYRRNDDKPRDFMGPGFGVRFYLKDITIPAIGADIAYDFISRHSWISVAIGFRPPR